MIFKTLVNKLLCRVLPNIKYLPQSKFRTCGICLKPSLFISLSEGEEVKLCIWCRANLRYEMLAEYLRLICPDLRNLTVLEIGPSSPLSPLLANSNKYIPTYFSPIDKPGSIRYDGVQCEDITKLTLEDNSIDIIISSDVLEHVPDIKAAFRETKRVLRQGGFHLFTVPPRDKTIKRAEINDKGKICHLTEPDYHSDPLNPKGILAFWDFGVDAIQLFAMEGLEITIVSGPKGKDQRIVWKALKI